MWVGSQYGTGPASWAQSSGLVEEGNALRTARTLTQTSAAETLEGGGAERLVL